MAPKTPDPVRLEVFHHLLAGVCEEAGAMLQRSAASPNIRERRDFSTALFDADAGLIAQAAHIPVHLGSAGDSVRAVRDALDLGPGDVAAVNDPWAGGTHLPDVTLVRPLFADGKLAFWSVCRAHHADIGGAVAGSMGIARDVHGEGLIIPPVLIRRGGEPCRDVLAMISANVRGWSERRIDFAAQEASLTCLARRLDELIEREGLDTVRSYAAFLMDASQRIAGQAIRQIPTGTFHGEDALDDDGTGAGPIAIRCALSRKGGVLTFDWRETDDQAAGGVNANRSIAVAASVYALRCLCPDRLPTNEGVFRSVRVLTRPGSLLEPERPAPVAGGNVETSQRLVDVALAALREALPEVIPACSAGTMSNLTVGGRSFQLYETLPGGAGGGPSRAGASAVQTHMTNTWNTPVEETEMRYPLRVTALGVRRNSGGRGARRGGDGIVKEVEVLEPAVVSLFSERHVTPPPGVLGGEDGAGGRAFIVEASGRKRRVASKGTHELEPGQRIRVETPGGGGHG